MAADMFAALGAAVIDTDAISHELTRAGGAAMSRIKAAFGREYVQEDGSLHRARMRALVFSDTQSKATLEGILHPLIRSACRDRILQATAPYVILVVPLLLETGAYAEWLDRILVIDCDESRQVERVTARSGLAEDEIRRIMQAQIPRAERVGRADDVIRNDSDIDALRAAVEALHQRYLVLASGQS